MIEINAPFALLLQIFITFPTYDLVHDVEIIPGLPFRSIGFKGGSDEVQPLGIGC
jgi:hypothetical protein